MSLVGDALRRARQEAAEREGRRRGDVGPVRPAPPLHRTGRRPGPLLGVLLAVLAGVIGGAGAWWLLGGRGEGPGSSTPGRAAVVAPALAAVTTPSSARTDEAEPHEEEPPAGHAPTATLAPGPPATGEGPSSASERATPAPAVEGGEPLRHEAPREPARRRVREPGAGQEKPPAEGGGVRELLIEGEVGGVQLVLDYIAFRKEDPFAQINGQDVHVGSVIEGLRVEEITADYVRLKGAGGSVVLKVR